MAELTIGGGGSTAVASEHLLVTLDRVGRGARTCQTAAERLRPLTVAPPGDRWNGTGAELEQTAAVLRHEAEALELLGGSLRIAIDAYGWAESRARAWLEDALAPVVSTVGFLAGRLALGILPTVLPVLGIAAAAWMLLPASSRESLSRSADRGLQRAGAELLDDPATTAALRVLMTTVDDAALGALGVPPSLLLAYREAGLGTVAQTAGAALAIGVLMGDRGRAPVEVSPAGAPVAVRAPVGVAERVARIPEGAAQVRVEKFSGPGGDRFEVYVGGTAGTAVDGGPLVEGGDQPWDMSSNVALIAEHDSSSLQAVRAAIAESGAGAHSQIVFTGYSQGAAIATALAESGEYRTAGLVAIGAPTGGMPVEGGYPAVNIAHDDDIVTALGGTQEVTNATVVRVSRGDDEWQPGDPIIGGHDIAEYRASSKLVDASEAPLLRDTIARLPGSSLDREGEAIDYTARRLDESEISGCDPRAGGAAR